MTDLAHLPFEGAITRYFETEAPQDVRAAIEDGKKAILIPPYPYDSRMKSKEYEETLYALQIELAKLQAWVPGNPEPALRSSSKAVMPPERAVRSSGSRKT